MEWIFEEDDCPVAVVDVAVKNGLCGGGCSWWCLELKDVSDGSGGGAVLLSRDLYE